MEHTNIRVLLIAERAAKASSIENFLQQSMSPSFLVHGYDSPCTAMNFLAESNGGVDIILLDVGTVDRENAEKVFQQVHALVANIPIILLTGATENDLAMLLVKREASDGTIRETFMASPERLKIAITFALSRKEILGKHIKMSTELQKIDAAELIEYKESGPAETQPRAGIWLNGGYYVSTSKTANIKSAYKKSSLKPEASCKIVAFELQGRINGAGATPSMQLMPHKPTDVPKQ